MYSISQSLGPPPKESPNYDVPHDKDVFDTPVLQYLKTTVFRQ